MYIQTDVGLGPLSKIQAVKVSCHWKRSNQNAYLCMCMCSEWHGMTENGQFLLLLLSISLEELDYQLVWWMLRHQFRHGVGLGPLSKIQAVKVSCHWKGF